MKPLYFDLAPWIELYKGRTATLKKIISAKLSWDNYCNKYFNKRIR